jgi:hypothetical protein
MQKVILYQHRHQGARKPPSSKRKFNDKIPKAIITIITPYIDGNGQLQVLQRFRQEYVLKKSF